nr:MAG TPA: hypothetical protein [Caudoviricetes sp.]
MSIALHTTSISLVPLSVSLRPANSPLAFSSLSIRGF